MARACAHECNAAVPRGRNSGASFTTIDLSSLHFPITTIWQSTLLRAPSLVRSLVRMTKSPDIDRPLRRTIHSGYERRRDRETPRNRSCVNRLSRFAERYVYSLALISIDCALRDRIIVQVRRCVVDKASVAFRKGQFYFLRLGGGGGNEAGRAFCE